MKSKKIVATALFSLMGLAISSCHAENTNNPNNSKADSSTIEQTNKVPTNKDTDTTEKPTTITMNPDTSYTVGYQVGSGIAKQDFGLYDKQTIAGFKDAIDGRTPRISDSEIQRNMESLKDKMIKKQIDVANSNKTNSEEFMDQVAKMDNAIKVDDGVYYQMIKQGDGKKPSPDSQVTIAYNGTTPVVEYEDNKSTLNQVKEGKQIGPSFDSSKGATFPLKNLIECWKDALPKIPVGSTIVLYCSPDKAYGARAPVTIGPNQALSFVITLKSFK